MKFLEKSFQTGNFYLKLYVKGAKGCGAMKCHEARELLSPYIDNQITIKERQVLEKHLAICAHCSKELSELRSLVADLHELGEITAPLGFMDELHERLLLEKTVPLSGKARTSLYGKKPGWLVAAAAGFAVVIGIIASSQLPANMVAGLFERIPQPNYAENESGKARLNLDKLLADLKASKGKETGTPSATSGTTNNHSTATGISPQGKNSPSSQVAVKPDSGAVGSGSESSQRASTTSVSSGTSVEPLQADAVNLRIAVADKSKVASDLLRLAAANQSLVEPGSGSILMNGSSQSIELWVPRDKVQNLIKGIEEIGSIQSAAEGIRDMTRDYQETLEQLNKIAKQLSALQEKDNLTEAEKEKLQALKEVQSDLQGQKADYEAKANMVAVEISIQEEINP